MAFKSVNTKDKFWLTGNHTTQKVLIVGEIILPIEEEYMCHTQCDEIKPVLVLNFPHLLPIVMNFVRGNRVNKLIYD